MAKPKAELAKTQPEPSDLAEMPEGTLATRPDWIDPTDRSGTEHLTKEDMQLPRLALAQLQSPQLNARDPRYIEGLAFGDVYNNLTNEILREKRFHVVILRTDPPRGIEFAPYESGQGVIDMNVPANDPRMRFTVGPDGKSAKPRATKFYDYLVMTLPIDPGNPMGNVVALSLKGSCLKTAKQLNGLLKSCPPVYARTYVLVASESSNAKGRFAVWNVAPGPWLGKDLGAVAKELHEALKDRKVEFDAEAEPPVDPDPDADGAESEI
jgi:hypothetical protein